MAGGLKAMTMELLQDTLAPVWQKTSVPRWLSHCPDQDLISLHLSYHWTAVETAIWGDKKCLMLSAGKLWFLSCVAPSRLVPSVGPDSLMNLNTQLNLR